MTLSFIQELFSLSLDSDNLIMASFDVTSLFTDIPINKTIDIITNQLFSTYRYFNGFTREEFIQFHNLVV